MCVCMSTLEPCIVCGHFSTARECISVYVHVHGCVNAQLHVDLLSGIMYSHGCICVIERCNFNCV